MDKVVNWNDAQNILNLLHKYAWSFDFNNLDSLNHVFSAKGETGGTIQGEPGWGPWKGVDNVIKGLSDVRNTLTDIRRHQITTPVFHELTESSAKMSAYLSVFSTTQNNAPALVTTGEYHVNLSKDENGLWKIDSLYADLDHGF